MTTKPRIIFFGNERLATGVTTIAPTLRALIQSQFEIAAVISSFSQATSRRSSILEVAEVAKSANLPLLLPSRLSEVSSTIADLKPDIGVLVAYGKIVPQAIIDLFPRGIINLHPSLLPLHRGPTPIESTILSGDRLAGISLMGLTSAMDAGPIFDQATMKLSGTESKQSLADQLLHIGQSMLINALPKILSGELQSTPQIDSLASYDHLIQKDAGRLDWSKSATQLEREVRAYLTWPGSKTIFNGTEVTITSARISSTAPMNLPAAKEAGQPFRTATGEFAVTTASGELIIDRLKPAGKREMSGREFWAGHKQR